MLDILSRNAKFIIVALMLAGCTWLGFINGKTHERLKWQEEIQNEYVKKDTANRDAQGKLNDISTDYQKQLRDSERSAADAVTRITANGTRLRVKLNATSAQLRECGLLADGKAELHRETSEALIRITQDADAHVEALQGTIRTLQGKEGP